MDKNIKQRVFIVGCPRSGTTLLQTLLLQHSEIFSFPESHFFTRALLVDDMRNFRTYIGSMYAHRSLKRWNRILKEKGFSNAPIHFSVFTKSYVQQFIHTLDSNTIQNNKLIWIEKTPSHLYAIQKIKKYIPDAKFIHLIRNGEDVVASLYEVTNKYPEIWGKKYSIEDSVNRYNKDFSISQKYQGDQNHFLMSYDKLIDSIEYIRELYDFLNLDSPDDIKLIPNKQIIMEDEQWKSNNFQNKVIKTKNKKFNYIFNLSEQTKIKNMLHHNKNLLEFI